jgi:hypothetical protein
MHRGSDSLIPSRTWISKLAGQPEYYMNCAPIKVTGGTSKRSSYSGEDLISRNSLPNLFVANLANINSCKTTPGTDPQFPEPGDNVVKPNPAAEYASVSGTDCFAAGGSGDQGPPPGSGSPDTGTPPPETTAAPPSPSTGFVTSVSSTPVVPTTTQGGVFVSITSTSATPSGTSGPGGSTGALSGNCESEGVFNCVGGSQYQQCASGSWTALQAIPAGTTCAEGQSATLWSRKINRPLMRRGMVELS